MLRLAILRKLTHPLLMLAPIFLIACNTTQSIASKTKPQSSITDFRGLPLGSPPLPDMYLIPGQNKMLSNGYDRNKSFYLHGDELTIGDIKVDAISYDYIDEKLYSIYINLEQDSFCRNGEILATALAKKYETSMQATAFRTGEHFWEAEFTNLKLTVSCTNIFSGGKFFSTTVHITDPKLYQEYEKYLDYVISESKKSSSEKATSDL